MDRSRGSEGKDLTASIEDIALNDGIAGVRGKRCSEYGKPWKGAKGTAELENLISSLTCYY